MKSADRLLPFHLTLILTLAGIMTVTPRMPQVWNQIDPWMYLIFDGQWVVVDILYGLLACGICVWMASRLMQLSRFPSRLLLAWLPYGIWALASAAWSPFPGFSIQQWILGVLIALAALIFGFSVGFSRDRFRLAINVATLLVLGYLFLRLWLQSDRLLKVGFDTVLVSTWLAFWAPIFIYWLAERCDQNFGYKNFISILLLACLSFFFPQRMFALTMCLLTMVSLGLYIRWKVEPQRSSFWRSYMIVLAVFFLLSYIFFASSKPSSYIPGMGKVEGSWYMVFFNSERYNIYHYWLRRGLENLWHGVGLGWQLPAMVYNRFHYNEMVMAEMAYSHAHNLFINIWLQLGLVGVVFYVLWLVSVGTFSTRGFLKQSVQERRLTLVIGGMILVLLVRNAVDDGMREGNVFLFWCLIGLVLGMKERSTGNALTGCSKTS